MFFCNILKVYENTLSSLRTKVYGVLCILGNALEGLKHQVKLTDICEIVCAAAWTADILLVDVVHHFFLRPAVHRTLGLDSMSSIVILNELICTEPLLTLLTVHQRV